MASVAFTMGVVQCKHGLMNRGNYTTTLLLACNLTWIQVTGISAVIYHWYVSDEGNTCSIYHLDTHFNSYDWETKSTADFIMSCSSIIYLWFASGHSPMQNHSFVVSVYCTWYQNAMMQSAIGLLQNTFFYKRSHFQDQTSLIKTDPCVLVAYQGFTTFEFI